MEEENNNTDPDHSSNRKLSGWDYFLRRCRQNFIPWPKNASYRERSHFHVCEPCQYSWIAWVLQFYYQNDFIPGQVSNEIVRSHQNWPAVEDVFLNEMSESQRLEFYESEWEKWLKWAKTQQKMQKPLTAYHMFMKEKHQELQSQYDFTERVQTISNMWKNMNAEEKKIWENKICDTVTETDNNNNNNNTQEKLEMEKKMPLFQKQILKCMKKIKQNKSNTDTKKARLPTAYTLYVQQLWRDFKSMGQSGMSYKDVMQKASIDWNKDESIRNHYKAKYDLLVSQYVFNKDEKPEKIDHVFNKPEPEKIDHVFNKPEPEKIDQSTEFSSF